MDKYTNFSISGSGNAPQYGTLNAGAGISINQPIKIEIDKEWVKRLLVEYEKIFHDGFFEERDVDKFFNESEVWNGR